MILALILAQVVIGPAGPNKVAEPATEWKCRYTRPGVGSFELSALFPEAPIGWEGNRALPTVINGDGPTIFLGPKGVKSYSPEGGKRRYQVSFSDALRDRYNLNFLFAEKGESPADITHWSEKAQKLATYANGVCTANFLPAEQPKL